MYLKLAKISNISYYILKLSSLLIKKVRPFKILEKISLLVYKLELLLSISRIYPIILVIYLE